MATFESAAFVKESPLGSPPPNLRTLRTGSAAPLAAPARDDLDASLVNVGVRLDRSDGTLWCGFRHPERPAFTPGLLRDLAFLQRRLRRHADLLGDAFPVRSVVWHSTAPGIWNLGGDLTLFVELIRAGDHEALRHYARACVDAVWRNWTKLEVPVLTIALVQGDALGGGFEAVLTNDVVIAEEGSRFGLPEALFNLFPGMGAYSLLCRRIPPARVEEMIRSGKIYEVEELADLGLVDQVVPAGEGVAAVRTYLDRNARRHRLLRTLAQVRRRCQPLAYDELTDVVDLWVDAAMALDPADLRRMERLVAAQRRRHVRTTPEPGLPTVVS